MILDLLNFIAVQMNQLPTFFAFAMVANLGFCMGIRSHIFKTGGRIGIYYVLINEAFVYQAFQLSVYRRLTDVLALLLAVFAYVGGCNVSRHLFKI
jgi:hypothetical protein